MGGTYEATHEMREGEGEEEKKGEKQDLESIRDYPIHNL